MKNGAAALIKTLIDSGIDTCFTNPGTSEMHFVAALDSSDMRAVLCLFEGVATGAADGYARMLEKPAATLLHLGCGLGNGLANLHNARKARVPMVNIIGDHATYHTKFDAQLQSDIETVARNISTWVRTTSSTGALCKDAVEAISVAKGPPSQISTLILPADISWGENVDPAPARAAEPAKPTSPGNIEKIASILKNEKKVMLMLGGKAVREQGLIAASRIAEKTGVKTFCEVFPTRIQRGEGLPFVERIAYLAEMASVQMNGMKHMILIDSRAPVSFFAYPGKKSYLVPEGCEVLELSTASEDVLQSLEQLVKAVDATDTEPNLMPLERPKLPKGKLTAEKVCQAIGALLPENCIISDEAQTSGVKLPYYTASAPGHDVLTLTGGAIGQGLPVAVGAAVACPGRKVLSLVGDGSAMYTIQSLWTMKQENLDVVVVVFNNRSYAILNIELQRVGADKIGPKARGQLDLSEPAIDFVALARGMGVPAEKVDTAEDLNEALQKGFDHKGPYLIDAIVPSEYEGLRLKALPHMLTALDYIPNAVAKAIKRKLMP